MWVRCWCPNGSFSHGFRWLATWLCQRRGDQWSGRAVGTRGFRVGTWICVHRRWPIRYQGHAHKHVMRIPPTQHTHTHARHVCTTYVHRGPASREPAVQRYCLRPHAVPATTGADAGRHRGTHAWGPTKSPRSRRHRSRVRGRACAGGELVPAVWGWRPNLHGAGVAGKVVPAVARSGERRVRTELPREGGCWPRRRSR